MNKRYSALLFIIGLAACEDADPLAGSATTGNLDFRSYVSIGNSITAGFQSNALYSSAQQYSYPNLIAQQAKLAGGSLTFTQPSLKEPGVMGRMRLTKLTPLTIVTDSSTINPADPGNVGIYMNPALPQFGYTNLGIPGARVYNTYTGAGDVLDTLNSYTKSFSPSYGQNPFYHVVLRNPFGGQPGNDGSVLKQAKKLSPTFMTVWLGNNDILGYASSGGKTAYTPVSTFQAVFNSTIDSLRTTGAKLLLGTIPDITALPLFTTIKWFVPDPFDPSKPFAGAYIPLVAQKSGGVTGSLGPDDFVLLTAASFMVQGYGLPVFSGLPHAGEALPDSVVLDAAEIAIARSITSSYNSVIRAREDANIGVVDFQTIFNDILANGRTIAGQMFSTAYISGGIFTLDGVHPTSQAQGLIANEFIRVMNQKWGASIPNVDVLSLPGLPIPFAKGEHKLKLSDIPAEAIRKALRVWQ